MSDYRPVHSRPKESNGHVEPMTVEFRSHDSDALDRLAAAIVEGQQQNAALLNQVVRLIQEITGAQARIQIPTPHVTVEAARAPDVKVDAPRIEVEAPQVSVPPAQVTVESAPPRDKHIVLHRDARGFLESADIEER